MYTMENYIWGLVAYGLGVLLVTPLLWWITRFLPWHPLRAFFRILVLVVLLTPMIAHKGKDFLAPAWVVGVFHLVQPQEGRVLTDALTPIFVCFVLIYLLDLAVWLFIWRRRRGSTQTEASTQQPATESVAN
ncbi:MAG TPA: hypothetical protein DIT58_16025 [Porticoccaceae bacterium]|nr:hypothetical protein [Porticoccaceae bacterium]